MQGMSAQDMQRLFGGGGGAGGGGPAAPLAKFKAGKCDFAKKDGGPTLRVTPSPRKGLIQLVRDQSDGMVHFQWKDRTADSVVDDILVFDGDCSFLRVERLKWSERKMRESSFSIT